MPQALITLNAVAGSDTDLPINTLVQCDNTNSGGETSYLWEFISAPPGNTAAFSAPATQNPTFTPDVEGTYLLKLTVNGTLTNQVVAAVRQLKTRLRIPAPGETTESDTATGWGDNAAGEALVRVDTMRADPGLFVAQAGGALNAGDVVRVSGVVTIKSGLPGQEDVPEVTSASAATAAACDEQLGVIIATVDGNTAVSVSDLCYVRTSGLVQALTGAPAVGDPVYLSDPGAIALTAGTVTRQLGHVAAQYGGLTYDAWVDTGIGYSAATSALGNIVEDANPVVGVGVDTGVLLCNSPAAAVAVALPAGATHVTKRVTVKDKGGNGALYNITITASGGETIDGAATVTIAADYGSVDLVFYGTEWSIT
jgi:hypothetical protein